jgi:hypothetical protein
MILMWNVVVTSYHFLVLSFLLFSFLVRVFSLFRKLLLVSEENAWLPFTQDPAHSVVRVLKSKISSHLKVVCELIEVRIRTLCGTTIDFLKGE